MEDKKIKEFVKEWMNSHEPGTFVSNENGVYIYKAGPSGINLPVFFEAIIEDYLEETQSKATTPKR